MAQARRTWWTDPDAVGGVSPERLVFLDECGVLTTLSHLHGRSPRGIRACALAPFGHWTRVTVLGALGAEGIVGAMSVAAATRGAVFCAYLEQVLLPELRRTKPDAVLVMDPRKSLRDFADLAAHKTAQVRALLDASGFAYHYLPAYSPDLNPIEPAWVKVKARATPPRCAHDRGPARGTRPCAGPYHPTGRGRVLPPLWLCSSQLTCKML